MRSVVIDPCFASWRQTARALLAEAHPPDDVLWSTDKDRQPMLFPDKLPAARSAAAGRVPASFLRLAETVSCHRSGDQWSLLYEILWALTRGKDPAILHNRTHPAIRRLEAMRKTIHRDIHKMHAFVRFRRVPPPQTHSPGRENFAAWYEPEHRIVKAATPFFRKRFGGMNWSTLTPDICAHWDGIRMMYTEGATRSEGPASDDLEELWRIYYRSTFNPARLKVRMMQSEMPRKYWKNLPESTVIDGLIRESAAGVRHMMQQENRPVLPVRKNAYLRNLETQNSQPQAPESSEEDQGYPPG